jgi:hypothetical protein
MLLASSPAGWRFRAKRISKFNRPDMAATALPHADCRENPQSIVPLAIPGYRRIEPAGIIMSGMTPGEMAGRFRRKSR